MIRAVLFVVDGVLVQPWGWRERLTRDYGITPAMTASFFQGSFADCVTGRADLVDVLPPFLAEWGWRASPQEFVAQWCSAENLPDHSVLDVVAELRQTGLPCFVAFTLDRYLARDMQFEQQFRKLPRHAHS